MRAALLALGEALIDAITVGLVFNDENPAVRPRRRGGKQGRAGQKHWQERWVESHASPMSERTVRIG